MENGASLPDDTREREPLVNLSLSAESEGQLEDGDANKPNQSSELNFTLTFKILKTLALTWLFFSASTFITVLGPIMPELVVQTDSSVELVMKSISMRAVGLAAGGFIGGLTIDRWFEHVDLIGACIILIYGALGVAVGYIKSIAVLFVMFWFQGALEQLIRTAIIRMAMNLWRQKSSIAIFGVHVGATMGYSVAPKIMGLFLDPHFSGNAALASEHHRNSKWSCNSRNTNISTANTELQLSQPAPKYPADFMTGLWIVAAIGQCAALVFIGYYIHKRTTSLKYVSKAETDEKNSRNSVNNVLWSLSPKSCSPAKPTLAFLMMLALCFMFGLQTPTSRAIFKLIFSYARDKACMSIDDATTLNSLFFIFMAVGRFIAFLLSLCLHPRYIMQGSLVGLLASSAALYLWSDHQIVLWLGVPGIGLTIASLQPGSYALLNHYIEVTSMAVTIPTIGGAIGDIIIMFNLGADYDRLGPEVLWTYMFILSILMTFSIILLQVLAHIHGNKTTKEEI